MAESATCCTYVEETSANSMAPCLKAAPQCPPCNRVPAITSARPQP